MGRLIWAVLLVFLQAAVSYAEKNPLVGMWMLQAVDQKAVPLDPMAGRAAVLSPKTITFTEKSMEANGQLQRVEYEISGNEVVVWVEKNGTRYVVSGQTMKMQLPNPLTGKTSDVTYVRTTKEQAALAAKRAEDKGKAKAAEASKVRQQAAMAELQGRWYAQMVEEDGARTYESMSIRKSDRREEVVFIIRGDQMFSLKDSREAPFFAFTINPAPDPKTVEPTLFDAKHIDARFETGQIKGLSSLGLYRVGHLLGDETLGLCLAKPGDRNRPRSLETVRGDGRMCLSLLRSDLPEDAPTVSQ